jgi:hypothetical protein
MSKHVWKTGCVDRGVIKLRTYNKDGIFCGWLTLPNLIRRDEFQKRERLTNSVAAEVVSLKTKRF